MKIAITAESTIDLTQELLQQYDIKTIPFTVILGDKDYIDGDIKPDDIFKFVSETGVLPKTTALNEYEYEEFFKSILTDYDAVIHFALSSGISSSHSHAVAAANNLKNVYVIDSKSLSTGIALQAIYARKLAESGLKVEDIVSKVEDRKSKVQASFVIERLDYLHKGGRCSGFKMLAANVLKIRPCIVLKDGKMINDGSKNGKGSMPFAVKKYCEAVLNEFHDIDKTIAFITYSSATPEMVAAARTALEGAGVKTIYETNAGCTITSHCGEHTLGILYFNDGGTTL
ncbi:MAG: DegV family protein [Clostridia bacterium]|nr:DegV family protein [Clostridia bacterium]